MLFHCAPSSSAFKKAFQAFFPGECRCQGDFGVQSCYALEQEVVRSEASMMRASVIRYHLELEQLTQE